VLNTHAEVCFSLFRIFRVFLLNFVLYLQLVVTRICSKRKNQFSANIAVTESYIKCEPIKVNSSYMLYFAMSSCILISILLVFFLFNTNPSGPIHCQVACWLLCLHKRREEFTFGCVCLSGLIVAIYCWCSDWFVMWPKLALSL
jgi:hypothetical protein